MCCCTSTVTLNGAAVGRRAGDLERVVELGQVLRLELDVEHRADDLNDLADIVNARWHVDHETVDDLPSRANP